MSLLIPSNYKSELNIRQTEVAIKKVKDFFERDFSIQLNLTRVSAPLYVDKKSGINDTLNGVERPVEFDIKGISVAVASDIEKNFPEEKEIVLDYYAGGMPVLIKGNAGVSHGISVKVNGGTITSYRQYICSAENVGEKLHTESMISALDRLYEKFAGEKEVKIDNMFIAYTTDKKLGRGEMRWCVKKGNDIIIID